MEYIICGGKRWLWLTDRRLYETVTTFFLPNFCCFPLLQSFTFWSVIRWLMFWCVEACSPRRLTTWRWFFSSAFLLSCWYCQLCPIPYVLYRFGVQIMGYWISIILCHESATMPTDNRDQRSYLLCLVMFHCRFNVLLQLMLSHLRN